MSEENNCAYKHSCSKFAENNFAQNCNYGAFTFVC